MLKNIFILSLLILFACDDATVSSNDPILSKLYVCDQGSDRVVVLDPATDQLDQISAIDINFTDSEMDMEVPHFITIDESHGYWFVTTVQSGYVGMYDLEQDTLISYQYVGDSPALMAVDEDNQNLYISKMMNMGMMMPGGQVSELSVIDYSEGYLSTASAISLVDNENIVDFPEPHAISFASGTSRGLSLVTASFTTDWFSYMRLDNATVTPTAYSFTEGEQAPIPKNELFPLDAAQKDNRIFFSCRGSMDANINGQVRSWSLTSLDRQDESVYEFETSSFPWHIIESPVLSEVFVVLSGNEDVPGSAGLACLSYNDSGELSLKWQTLDSGFDTLHGVTVSADGSKVYVSSRGDGSIHIFDAASGNLLNTVDGIGMMMDMGMGMDMDMGSLSGIAITQ